MKEFKFRAGAFRGVLILAAFLAVLLARPAPGQVIINEVL